MHGLGASSHLTARFVSLIRAAYSYSLFWVPQFSTLLRVEEAREKARKIPALAVMNVMFWFFRFFLWLEFG